LTWDAEVSSALGVFSLFSNHKPDEGRTGLFAANTFSPGLVKAVPLPPAIGLIPEKIGIP